MQFSQSSPHTCNCFLLDDTELIGFPHLTNLARKDIARKSTFDVVPCLVQDVSRNQRTYIYSAKTA